MKLDIGDEVMSKKIGPPCLGKITAIMDGEEYEDIHGPHEAWRNHYPEWQMKNVYVVDFETPFRPITFDEFVDSGCLAYKQYDDERDDLQFYKDTIAEVDRISYPHDDLEKVDFANFV